MSKTLYIVWHGETLFGTQGRLEGWSDSPLTEEAREQARRTGRDFFAARGITPDRFCSSISERACDTLELVCEGAGISAVSYERHKGLKDLDYGIYEAQHRSLAPAAPYGSFFVKFQGESADQLAERVQGALVDIARGEGSEVLVSGHQLAIAQACALWDDALAARISSAPAGSVLVLGYDKQADSFSLVELFEPEPIA